MAGALLAALLSSVVVTVVTRLWDQPLHVPFEYTHVPTDDRQDATLDMMLIKDVDETGWLLRNPRLNAPFEQRWAEWPMGGDVVAYVVKKALVGATGDVPLTLNLFWLATFPLTALVAFPVLRSLRCSWSTALVGAVLFSLAPYHFRNGVAHENLAFYVGVPVIVLLCTKVLGPDSSLPSAAALRQRNTWWRMRWLLLGAVLVGVTGIYYLAFLLSLLALCAAVGALAQRRPGRLALAAIFGAVGFAASFLANLPTLLYRWQHPHNPLSVPERVPGAAELYPLRIVELLGPVTGHRFGPLRALADHLSEPGRGGIGTATLGAAAAIGFVCATVAVLVRAFPGRRDRWSYEARLGVVMIAALALATKGGLSRVLELTGLQGVRAWSRIAIVVAFAGIVVFARLLDRVRVALYRRRWRRGRLAWGAVLAAVVAIGALDQASPALMPNAAANARAWRADDAFVARIERQLPRNAMVFQLPVVDFPEHSSTARMSSYDEIKEGYLHSRTLRWSAGGVRGREGEWQFPASSLRTRDLVRGVAALGFSALTVDRYGYRDDGRALVRELDALLGRPIATRGDRLVAWDLRPATASLLRGMTPGERRALARRMLDAPRLYLAADVDRITTRGGRRTMCDDGTVTLVNPGGRVRRLLVITLDPRQSSARRGAVTIAGRTVEIPADGRPKVLHVDVPHGTTTAKITVDTPGVRCASAPTPSLPAVSAKLRVPRNG